MTKAVTEEHCEDKTSRQPPVSRGGVKMKGSKLELLRAGS